MKMKNVTYHDVLSYREKMRSEKRIKFAKDVIKSSGNWTLDVANRNLYIEDLNFPIVLGVDEFGLIERLIEQGVGNFVSHGSVALSMGMIEGIEDCKQKLDKKHISDTVDRIRKKIRKLFSVKYPTKGNLNKIALELIEIDNRRGIRINEFVE